MTKNIKRILIPVSIISLGFLIAFLLQPARTKVLNRSELQNTGRHRIAGVRKEEEMKMQRTSLSVLVYGNSFSYNEFGYAPALINEIYPDLDLTFGILYSAGEDLKGHCGRFYERPYTWYSEFLTEEGCWHTMTAAFTGQAALQMHDWDLVVLQQGSAQSYEYQNYEPWLDQLIALIDENANHTPEICWNLNHSWGKRDYRVRLSSKRTSVSMYEGIAECAARVMEHPRITHLIPSGTAVQNARTTELAAWGDLEDLCTDNRSHLQHGIGYLTASAAGAYGIMQAAGLDPFMGWTHLDFNDDWLNEYALPTFPLHGVSEGMSHENIVLAQKCAAAAMADPLHITDCSNLNTLSSEDCIEELMKAASEYAETFSRFFR